MKEITERQRILIFDDMPANIAVLGEAFHPEYEVMVATTGDRTTAASFFRFGSDLNGMISGCSGFGGAAMRRLG